MALPHAFSVPINETPETQGGARSASLPWATMPCTFGAKTAAERSAAVIRIEVRDKGAKKVPPFAPVRETPSRVFATYWEPDNGHESGTYRRPMPAGLFGSGNRPGSHGPGAAALLRRAAGRTRVRGAGAAAWADGAASLRPGPGLGRRRRRLPGHVSGAQRQVGRAPPALLVGGLAAPRGPPGRPESAGERGPPPRARRPRQGKTSRRAARRAH